MAMNLWVILQINIYMRKANKDAGENLLSEIIIVYQGGGQG
jgi:hypothetical protein